MPGFYSHFSSLAQPEKLLRRSRNYIGIRTGGSVKSVLTPFNEIPEGYDATF
jgi:hypothetical protein